MCYSCCTQSCIFLWSAQGHNTAAAFLRWCHELAHNNVPKKSIQSFPTLANCHRRWPVRFVKLKGWLFLKSSLGRSTHRCMVFNAQKDGEQCRHITFLTEGPSPSSTARAGSAHMVTRSPVLALAAVLAAGTKASFRTSCSEESKPDTGWMVEQREIFRQMNSYCLQKRIRGVKVMPYIWYH